MLVCDNVHCCQSQLKSCLSLGDDDDDYTHTTQTASYEDSTFEIDEYEEEDDEERRLIDSLIEVQFVVIQLYIIYCQNYNILNVLQNT